METLFPAAAAAWSLQVQQLSPAQRLSPLLAQGAGEAPWWTTALLAAAALVVGAVVGALLHRAALGRALRRDREEAQRQLDLARLEAQTAREKAELEAEKRILARREQFERELEQQRKELREQERRLASREDQLDRKLETLILKEDSLTKAAEAARKREDRLARREDELSQLIEQRRDELHRVAQLSREEARDEALRLAREDARLEADRAAREIIEAAEVEALEKAREITLNAIQRYAAEHTAESTVRTVPLPSDDMKGRVIGREGRNIRTLERVTGVDIIVDDTPGVIVVSSFDKIRQTVAVEALTKLLADGRVHPARIEEVVAQVQEEVHDRILQAGRDAVQEVKLRGIKPPVVEAMGKLHFRTSYGQNVLKHSIEVAFISQMIADQLGLKGVIARRCGFLHDIGKAMDHDMEGSHPAIGMEFARQHGEREPVLNAIGGHHGDIPATSFYTPIVMAADTISGSRPGARRESLERYIQRLTQLQEIAKSEQGVREAYAIQAGREVRVMVDAKRISDDEAFSLARRLAERVSKELTFPGEIKVTVLRETRAVEYAR